jgi:hypothetical protein
MPHPFVPLPNTMEANLRFLLGGQKIENVFHFSYDGASFGVAASEVSAMIQNEFWHLLRNHLSGSVAFKEIYLVDMNSADGGTYTAPIIIDPLGAGGDTVLPNNVAFCVSLRTEKRGRSFAGRSYVSGLTPTQVDGNYLHASTANAIIAAYENLRAVAATSTLPLVVASRKHAGVYRTLGVVTPVSAVVYKDLVLDSQRRRLPGRGS